MDTPSILPVKGASRDGFTIAGSELAFCCVVAYKCSLANSSLNCATYNYNSYIYLTKSTGCAIFSRNFNKGGFSQQPKQQFPK